MSYLLTQAQVSDLLSRNPDIAATVANAQSSNMWPNGNPVCSQQPSLLNLFTGSTTAIGYNVTDSVYGNITIACDANGNLQYNADSPVASSVMNAGPYTSPTTPPGTPPGCPGWSNIGSLNDALACLGSTATTLEWIFIGFLAYKAYKAFK